MWNMILLISDHDLSFYFVSDTSDIPFLILLSVMFLRAIVNEVTPWGKPVFAC